MGRYKIAKPHLIQGTNILKNKPGISRQDELDRFELLTFLARLDTAPDGNFSTRHLQKIHFHLLQDVYEWAGKFRNLPIEKGTSVFCRPEFIKQETDKVTKSIKPELLQTLSLKSFSEKLGEFIGELNAIHPFLDGNGRTIRIFAQKVTNRSGYHLNVNQLRGDSWNEASRISFFGNNQPLTQIIQNNLSKL